MTARRSKFGFPIPPAPRGSFVTAVRRKVFSPTAGYTEAADVMAPPESITSGANCWIIDGELQPRSRLSQLGSDTPFGTTARPVGAFIYDDIEGSDYPVAVSSKTVSYYNLDASWDSLAYESNTSNLPPSGGDSDTVFGTSVYLSRRDLNLAVFTNGNDPIFAWGGPSDNTAFSTLTQAPIAKDIAVFDNRLVAWNTRELSSATRYVSRVAWHVAGDPEDWQVTSVGAGTEDLVDARGEGTRIFALEDSMLLATTKELWRGRKVGLPFVFAFNPVQKSRDLGVGMPYPRAAIQTPLGVFWLHSDFMVYRIAGDQVDPVGNAIQDTLRATLKGPSRAFFGYDPKHLQVTLYYSDTAAAYPNKAFTLDVGEGVWTPHDFDYQLVASLPSEPAGTAVTWGELSGTLDEQLQTYEESLGRTETTSEAVITSSGTAAYFSSTASLDLDQPVESVAQMGALFAQDPDSIKLAQDVKLDFRADSASSLSVAYSGTLGKGYQDTQEFAVSVGSETTQVDVPLSVSGPYHTMRLRSDDTGWKLARVAVFAKEIGKTS